jgi:hypothetical protein
MAKDLLKGNQSADSCTLCVYTSGMGQRRLQGDGDDGPRSGHIHSGCSQAGCSCCYDYVPRQAESREVENEEPRCRDTDVLSDVGMQKQYSLQVAVSTPSQMTTMIAKNENVISQ